MSPTRDTIYRNSLIAAYIAVVMLLVAAGSFTYQQMSNMVEQRRVVLRTHEVIASVSRLETSIRDAESGQRGYLLTGKENYLRSYERGRIDTPQHVQKLEAILSGERQKTQLGAVKKKITEKLNELAETLRLSKLGDKDAAIRMVLSDVGENTMETLMADLESLQSQEEQLLEERSKLLADSTDESFARLGFLAILAVGCFVLASVVIHSITTARRADLAVQETIFEVSRILASALSTEEAVDGVLKVLANHFEWSIASFWQVNAAEDGLECRGFYSAMAVPDFESLTRTITLQKNVGLPGRVWQTCSPHWVEDVAVDPNFPRQSAALKDNLHGGFAFPIIFGDQFLGVFEFFSEKIEPLSKKKTSTVDILAVELGQFFQRQKLEEKAKISQSRFDQLVGSIDDVFFIFLPDFSKMFYVSPAYERIWGRPKSDMDANSMAFMDGILEDDREKVLQVVSTFPNFRPGDFAEVEYRVIHTDGTLRWVNVRAFPSVDPITQEARICGTVRDITRQKDAERRVNEFYSTVSHELRTPLTSIRGALGLLEGGKAGELSARGKQLVEMGRRECERLVRLINDILDVRKVEAGKLELKTENIRPSEKIQQILNTMHSYAHDRDVTLKSQIDCDTEVIADPDRFSQILTNLISNAVKYAPQYSDVLVSTRQKGDMVRFSVTDTGAGISKDNQSKLFKLFQQVDSSDSRPKEGTGLGLAICKALVEQHGGTIGVDSEEGKGSTFWFDVPAVVVGDVDLPPVVGTKAGAKRILIVEDDDAIALVMSETLAGEGFHIERVSELSSALARIEQNSNLAAVILDLGLPDGDGFDFIKEVQRRGLEMPVVIVTAREEAAEWSYPLVVDWITKPFGHQRLLRAVQLAVGGRTPGQARVMVVEDDPSTLDVMRQQLQGLDIRVFEAKDGRTAIDIANKESIDLIVLDLGLPDIDGYTVVTIFSNEPKLRDIPLIVYTANDLTDSDRDRLRLGLTSYLTKAKTSDFDFMASVRKLLNGLLKPQSDEVVHANVEISKSPQVVDQNV